MKVRKVKIPEQSLIAGYLPANYSDAFECKVKGINHLTADDIQIAFWITEPRWIRVLFKIRDILVKPFGLKAGGDGDTQKFIECIRSGRGEYRMASMIAKSENETIVCLNDKHLKAYMSVYIRDAGNDEKQVFSTTLVFFHYWLGYVYFYLICPFHHLVVRSMLKNAMKRIARAE